jgi:SAM-dependent methyltransferase
MGERLSENEAFNFYNYYNKKRDVDENKLKKDRLKMYELDSKLIQLFVKSGKILDYGCGAGEFLDILPSTFNKYGFDVDLNAVAEATTKYEAINFLTDINSLETKFDAIIFRGTLQYQRDLTVCKRFIDEHLNPNGLLILLATPNVESPVAEILRDDWGLFNQYEHLYYFSISVLRDMFKNMELKYYDFPYVGTPYENIQSDLESFKSLLQLGSTKTFPFWGSMMNLIFVKKYQN